MKEVEVTYEHVWGWAAEEAKVQMQHDWRQIVLIIESTVALHTLCARIDLALAGLYTSVCGFFLSFQGGCLLEFEQSKKCLIVSQNKEQEEQQESEALF